MSAKYSRSPALRLIVGKSRLRRLLHGAYCLCTCFALLLLHARGYPALAVLLLPPVGMLLWQLHRETMVGAVVCWRQGSWTVEHNAINQAVRVCASSTCLPGVIYLAWQALPDGRRGSVWLFADSAPPGQLRCLRARLADPGLSGGVL